MVRGVKNHTATTARPGISQAVRHVLREACALLLLPLAIYLFLSLVTRNPTDPSWSHSGPVVLVHNLGGRVGAYLADGFFEIFGIVAYVFPLLLVWLALRVLRSAPVAVRSAYEPTLKLIGLVSFILAAAALATLAGGPQSSLPVGTGGILGKQIAWLLASGLGETGAVLLLFALCLVGITLATGFSWFRLMDWVGLRTLGFLAWLRLHWRKAPEALEVRAVRLQRSDHRKQNRERKTKLEPVYIEAPVPIIEKSERATREQQIPLFTGVANPGELPPLSLLDKPIP